MSNNSPIVSRHNEINALVGGEILSLITSGMYTSPLAILREYLQNAADSVASSTTPSDGRVEIKINIEGRSVTICDNGPGLSHTQAKRLLIPISRSQKSRQHNRGFRGIGRLSGLAFGNSVLFLTRRNGDKQATQITWNGEHIRIGIDKKLPIEKIIEQSVVVEKVDADGQPANFFEVQVKGISRHAASSILNRDAVRKYVGEVCSVPFDVNFPYTSHVSKLFEESQLPLVLEVCLDGDIEPVSKLYEAGVNAPGGRLDEFIEFEEVKIPALGDKEYVAIGWIAHTSYRGAIPKEPGVRCLRARMGNIQIGGESVFDHLFSEHRFNRWCVGEIHIVDSRVVPNGRRDYFEPNVHLRNLENQLSAVCRQLERRCRTASSQRNQRKHFESFLEDLESSYELVKSGYLTASATRQFIERKLSDITDFQEKYSSPKRTDETTKLEGWKNKLSRFRCHQGQSVLNGFDVKEKSVYKKVFQILAATSPSPRQAKKTIEAILDYE